ncbi:capsid protein [Candida viswanathii]|uniref:Capsid protein n=1 Tax=Candida viswanathii TaxID=5486 RepID=A0A367XYL9_9ASCO|nr:capsid protein [Candida viswanathii]
MTSIPDHIIEPIRFVKLDYTEFDDICSIISTMCQSISTLLQVTDDEVISYLHTCLEAYVVINQQEVRNRAGRYDPAISFLPSIIHIFKLPKYFKSVIREMARPMYDHEGVLYLPDIPALDINAFVDNTKLMIRSQIIQILGDELKIELFPVDMESIQPVQFAVYHENSNEILSFDNKIPAFRTRALNALKNIKFEQLPVQQFEDGKFEALLQDETVKVVSDIKDLDKFTNPSFGFYYRDKLGKVLINGVPMVRSLHGFYNKPKSIYSEVKFPTDDLSKYANSLYSRRTASGSGSSSLSSIFNSSPLH